MAKAKRYIPPLNYDWLTPLYDRFIPLVMPETDLKRRLIKQAGIRGGDRVLDLGAGTATLALMIKRAYPQAEIIGIDGDPHVLQIARSKVASAGLAIRLDEGFVTNLPYEDASFDRVFSSLMLHHLPAGDKLLALAEVRRVLRQGGELDILDFGKPHNLPAYLISLVTRHGEQVADNVRGRIPEMLHEAGFADGQETERHMTVLGTLSLYCGHKEA